MGTLNPKDPDYVYLAPSKEIVIADRAKPYDVKVDCWIRDTEECYVLAKIQSVSDDEQYTVADDKGNSHVLPKAEVFEVNPPKFEKAEDMSDLSFLNDAAVLYNLRARYSVMLIYTYSGLFCICINPYAWLPIYSDKMRNFYRGPRRNERPPHLYAIADGAFQHMEMENKNQSMLITGESGAGKTENTKKVLQYYALEFAAKKTKAEQEVKTASLEDQIVQANPVLEAYGNAKTVRNNNSSRFGKFIRVHFGPTRRIAGADIETYLLEKSRITFQLEIERNYHIFYQMLSSAYPQYHEMLGIEEVPPNPGLFFFIAQGVLTVDRMDDAEEMRATDEAYDILGFSEEDKKNMYRGSAAIMWLGNAKFKQKGDQAEPDGVHEVTKAADLLGLDADYLVETLIKPKLKVGKEFVKKGQTADQVSFSVSATCKSLYARMFDWMVAGVNKTLDTPNPRVSFMGVLDIAGFEIFDLNVLEQLLINYTNERLQQFFNHHMFVVEQEEYKKEGIEWKDVDFGMNLIHTIELIEKKMGILSMLEEECIVPKATDMTYLEKMMNKHLGKHASFGKPKPAKNKPEAHFEIHHYAGSVGYNVSGWLFKNKDPVNDAVVTMMSGATNGLVSLVFTESGEKKKGSSMATISAAHRESLMKLMTNLNATHPHFVRCIIPNEIKKPGHIDAPLVMHQLTCNGVLQGIAICRMGFPNRVGYPDFKPRYSIVAPKIANTVADDKLCADGILKEAAFGDDDFKVGHTKVFFRAGKLALLEEVRENALAKIFVKMQSHIRKIFVKLTYDQKVKEKTALASIQRNIKIYYRVRDWPWMQFYQLVLGETANIKKKQIEAERKKKMQEGIDKIKEVVIAAVVAREEAEKANEAKKKALRRVIAEHAYQLEMSGAILNEIVAMETEVADIEAKATEATAKLEQQRSEIRHEAQGLEGGEEKKKIAVRMQAGAMRDKMEKLENQADHLVITAKHAEKQNIGLKMEIKELKEASARIQATHGRHLREKNEMWTIVSEMREKTHNENQATLNYRSYCKPVLPPQFA